MTLDIAMLQEQYDALVKACMAKQAELADCTNELNQMRRRANDWGFTRISEVENERTDLINEFREIQQLLRDKKAALRTANRERYENHDELRKAAKDAKAALARSWDKAFIAAARRTLSPDIWETLSREATEKRGE